MFIMRTSFKSLIRQPLITTLLLINMTVMTLSLLVVMSALHTEWRAYIRHEATRVMTFQDYPNLKELLGKLEQWQSFQSGASASPLATVKLPLSYGSSQGSYSVSGFGKDNPALGHASDYQLQPRESLLSYPLAVKLGEGHPDRLIGHEILIDDQPFVIAGILEDSSLDTAFVSYETLAELADPVVTALYAQISSSGALDTLLADLAPYQPAILAHDDAYAMAELKQTLVQYAALSALLVLFSLVSFLQLFQCKLRADAYRWSIFGLHGARRSHMLGASLLEAAGIVASAFGLGLALFAVFREYVRIPNVVMTFDVRVLGVSGALSLLLLALLAAVLPVYIHGRRSAGAHLSA